MNLELFKHIPRIIGNQVIPTASMFAFPDNPICKLDFLIISDISGVGKNNIHILTH